MWIEITEMRTREETQTKNKRQTRYVSHLIRIHF